MILDYSAQARAARLSAWVELALAVGILTQVARNAWLGSTPEGAMMMATSVLALIAIVSCMLALA